MDAIMGGEAHYRAIVQGKNFHAVNVGGFVSSGPTDVSFAELSSKAPNHWYRVRDTVYVWYVDRFAVRFTYGEYVKSMEAECGDCEPQDFALCPEPGPDAACTPVDLPPIAPSRASSFESLHPSSCSDRSACRSASPPAAKQAVAADMATLEIFRPWQNRVNPGFGRRGARLRHAAERQSARRPGVNDRDLEKVNLQEKLQQFEEHWSPRIVGELNGQHVKLAKLAGEFIWHHHEAEDELFLVVQGHLSIHLRDRVVELDAGEFFIVPRGVEHKPVASSEAHVLLLEPASTLNTGNVRDERTVADPKHL